MLGSRRPFPSLEGARSDSQVAIRHPAGVKNVIDVRRVPLLTDTLGGIEISEPAAAASPLTE